MKPTISSFAILTALLAVFLTSWDAAYSGSHEKRKRVVLPAGETHQGWYFAAGDQVLIEGTVNGDAYVAGGFVEVNGTINGDLLVVGGYVSVNGTVTDDIRAAGGNLEFDGKVGKNVSAAGGNIMVGKTGTIQGSLLTACGTLQMTGAVQREAKVFAGDASVIGKINGTLQFQGGLLSVLEGANIGGDLVARIRNSEDVDVAAGAVRGKVDISEEEMKAARGILGFRPWRVWFKIAWTLSLILSGLVFVFAFPKQLLETGSTILRSPGKTILWGIGGLTLIPIATGILIITVIGIPLGLFVLVMYLWLLYLSQLSLGIVIGERFLNMTKKTGWSMLLVLAGGILIVQAVTLIPYVRALVVVAGAILGIGALLLMLKDELAIRRRR